MKKILYFVILVTLALSKEAMAQNASIFPKGEKAANVHHVGNVWLNELSPADSTFTYGTSLATMERGAYLYWHKHPGGQILMIIDGIGYYQEKGKPKQTVRKGDVIKCQPDVEHWHGATPTTGVTYLATSPAEKGKTIWLQQVTEKEYSEQPTKQVQTQKN